MIKYPKTKQFSDVVRDIRHKARYKGLDENGQPIYTNEDLPKIQFIGTVKLHGTNAGITWNAQEGIKCQSRNRVVTDGHFGFPEMVAREREIIGEVVRQAVALAREEVGYDVTEDTISIFGEWAGPGIQNGVGISNLKEKTWFIFGIKVNIASQDNEGIWLKNVYMIVPPVGVVKNIWHYPSFNVLIDFNVPALSQNYMVEKTLEVEEECPVAKALIPDGGGIGEGIVWTGFWQGERFIFKTKGEKHSSSKVKTIAPVDAEKVKSVSEFVENSVTLNRVRQGMLEVCDIHDIPVASLSRKHTGDLLKWVVNDILTEEEATMQASGLEKRDVSKSLSDKARRIFFDLLDTIE